MAGDGEWETLGGGTSLFEAIQGSALPVESSGGGGGSGGGVGGLQFDLPPFIPIRQLTGNISVAAGSPSNPQTESFVREMPFAGWLANVRVWWDQGANQLTGVQLKEGGPNQSGQIHLPRNPEDDFIALNGTNETFWMWLPLPAGKQVTITVRNIDGEGHSIPFIITAVEMTDFLKESLPEEILPEEPSPESD